MNHRSFRFVVSLTAGIACSATNAFSQSKEDRATLERARAAYLVQPVPSSISCGVELDWERFFQEMKMEMNDATKARLDKLKAVKITVVSKGEAETEVKVDAPDGFASMADGLRQQLGGFFQMYWAMGYGKMLAVKPEEPFGLTKMPEGYKIGLATGEMKVEMTMDKAYVITSESVSSPQMNAVMTPGFKPGADGLLRLRSVDETIELGASRMVVKIGLDYQKVGEFDVPQHVHMSLPGSFSFNYTFVGCEVKGANSGTSTSRN